jgi:hypothetical protein
MRALAARLRAGLPLAATSLAAMLATFGTALGLRYAFGLPPNLLILGVVLALSISRRQPGKTVNARVFALLALPLISVGATEVGTQMATRQNLGDALFVLGVTASIWARRFGGPVARVGALAGLPLIAILIAPAAVPGSSPEASSRWWAALIAVAALLWVTASFTVAEKLGWLPLAAAGEPAARRPSRRRAAVVDRMALRMLVSLTLAFVLGRWLFATHWPWLVITAFVVSSGGADHADVLWRGVQRVIGAGIGTLGATLVAVAAPAGSPWTIVLIFAVLGLASWLRPLNYAFWAGGVTAVLALLYGYYGERSSSLLLDRLEEIALGAATAVTISWLVTLLAPHQSDPDPLSAATERVLGYVNRRHDFGYRLVRRLPSGGYLVRGEQGDAVLRWSRDPSLPFAADGTLACGATPSGYPYAILARPGRRTSSQNLYLGRQVS